MPCSLVEEHFAPKNAICIFKIYLNQEDGGSVLLKTDLLYLYVGFWFSIVTMKVIIFWNVGHISLADIYQHFGGRRSSRFLRDIGKCLPDLLVSHPTTQ
jgi:hypothetical protein